MKPQYNKIRQKKNHQNVSKTVNTVQSLEFQVAKFSWYLWVALSCKFTSSTKTNLRRFGLPTETKKLAHQ